MAIKTAIPENKMKKQILELTVSKCQGYLFFNPITKKFVDAENVIYDHEVEAYVEETLSLKEKINEH